MRPLHYGCGKARWLHSRLAAFSSSEAFRLPGKEIRRHRLFTTTVAAAVVVAGTSMLTAQESKPQMDRMHKGMEMMKDMDADANGEISREEFVQAHEKMFDSMDENGDGALDQEEQATMMRKMHHESDGMGHHGTMGDRDRQ
jgi:hypothetical protein